MLSGCPRSPAPNRAVARSVPAWGILRRLRTPTFLLSLLLGLGTAALLLVLATVLDVPALRYVALVAIVGVVAAREAWAWRGNGRLWLVVYGGLAGTIVLAFVIERLS